jgi:hypothetical protein
MRAKPNCLPVVPVGFALNSHSRGNLKHRLSLPLALALTLASSLPAWAAPSTQVSTYALGNSNIDPPSPVSDSENLVSNSGAPLTSASSVIGNNALWTLTAQSSAHAQPGLIQLQAAGAASATYVSPPAISYVAATASTSATARWQDSFTIDGGALNGTIGQLVAGFQVDGTLTSSYDSSVNSGASISQQYRSWLHLTNPASSQDVWERGGQRHDVDYQGDRWLATDMPLRAPGQWTITIDFKFGTPIQVDMWGDIVSYAGAYACTTSIVNCSTTSNISSAADFGHTIFWDGFIGLTDASGNPVSNYSLSSDSGFDYRYSAMPVPEPSVALMLLTGLGLVGGLARRRIRR